ncbi:MAG TPA: DoxX family protein [Candidatus Binatia bacterium]|nr:DoxX family protein [Candidatus Binatia bacterium]
MSWIFETSPSFGFVFLRVGLAVAFFAHSTQQIFGWFDGRGLKGMLANWKEKYGIPVPISMLGMFVEFFGSFALLIGFLTRPFALGLAIFMAVAMQKAHWEHGFFLARRPGEGSGIEYCLALFLMALALLVGGGGALSIDGLLSR